MFGSAPTLPTSTSAVRNSCRIPVPILRRRAPEPGQPECRRCAVFEALVKRRKVARSESGIEWTSKLSHLDRRLHGPSTAPQSRKCFCLSRKKLSGWILGVIGPNRSILSLTLEDSSSSKYAIYSRILKRADPNCRFRGRTCCRCGCGRRSVPVASVSSSSCCCWTCERGREEGGDTTHNYVDSVNG